MRHDRGFTLLEMLVALTLGSAVLALLAGATWVFMGPRNLITAPRSTFSADFNRISRVLKGAFPLSPVNPGGRFLLVSTPYPVLTAVCSQGGRMLPEGPDDIHSLTLVLNPDQGAVLTLDNGFSTPAPMEYTLFRDARELSMECMDPDGNWVDEWVYPDKKELPHALRITAVYPSGQTTIRCRRTVVLPTGSNTP